MTDSSSAGAKRRRTKTAVKTAAGPGEKPQEKPQARPRLLAVKPARKPAPAIRQTSDLEIARRAARVLVSEREARAGLVTELGRLRDVASGMGAAGMAQVIQRRLQLYDPDGTVRALAESPASDVTFDELRERILTLQVVASWALGAATCNDRKPAEEAGLKRTMEHCLRAIETADPGGHIRREMQNDADDIFSGEKGAATPGVTPALRIEP